MKHYSEVELLEQYYLVSGQDEVGRHVGECEVCATRYQRLREKLSCSAADHRQQVNSKPESFWVRQRMAIQREIARGNREMPALAWRLAVAAVLLIFAGAAIVVVINSPGERLSPQVVQSVPAPEMTDPILATVSENSVPADPWESDQLQPYSELVEWESWLAESEEKGT